MKLFLAVLVLAAVGYLAFQHHQAAAEARHLGAIASGIAGRPVHIHCQNLASAAIDVTAEEGSVRFDSQGRPSNTADLKRDTCQALGRVGADARAGKLACLAEPDSCPARILADAQAVHVFTHEAYHLRGLEGEAEAECGALASTAWTAVQLGATPHDAGLVADYARDVLYPLLPADYQSATCH